MNPKNIWVIFKKDFRSYFNSPIAYIVVVAYLLISGFLFFNQLLIPGGMQEASLRAFFSGLSRFFLIIFSPAITMRLIAEEKGSGTIELLSTLPVSDLEVVVGKFLAAMGLVLVALGLTVTYPITVSLIGSPDLGPIVGGYVGLVLMIGASVALGVMASSWVNSQIAAFILGFFLCLVFFLLHMVLPFFPDSMVGILEYLSFDFHFQGVERGVLDSRNILYYLSLIVFCLIVASESLQRRKWATA
ncbi:MAG: ABC transporter permease subunit [Myxococcota bacterium]|jgi:ABC-2 type transport system permease protein|nr:ABC transporter permease subunit [Myxococcota bacterium]